MGHGHLGVDLLAWYLGVAIEQCNVLLWQLGTLRAGWLAERESDRHKIKKQSNNSKWEGVKSAVLDSNEKLSVRG